MVESAMPDLEKALEEHKRNPEKHPLYPTEWKQFWNRRNMELQAGIFVIDNCIDLILKNKIFSANRMGYNLESSFDRIAR